MWSKVPCLRKQRDGRGPPDPEFEVLTARPHTPSQYSIKNAQIECAASTRR